MTSSLALPMAGTLVLPMAGSLVLGCAGAGLRGAKPSADECRHAALAVQVLGSGGAVADGPHAGSGALVWVDGHARVLIDAGGGVFARFGEAGASLEDLDVVALSALRAERSADLVALLESGFVSGRQRTLSLIGPSGGELSPTTSRFIGALLHPEGGAYPYLSPLIAGQGGHFRVDVHNLEAPRGAPRPVLRGGAWALTALDVDHGGAPALAYRVTVRGQHLVFASGSDALAPGFAELVRGASLLVVDAPPSTVERRPGPPTARDPADSAAGGRVATPAELGDTAARAAVPTLLVSRHGEGDQPALARALRAIAERYPGSLRGASELECYVVESSAPR